MSVTESKINSLEFATKFTGELDKLYVQKAVTGFLADNTFRAKFVGAKTVILPDFSMVGLADYDRDNGFDKGSMNVGHQSYELTQDRGRSFQIDREDLDETGVANLAGQVLSEFVRTRVVPETDAYILSNLYKAAAKVDGNVKTYEEAKVIANLLATINAAHDKAGYDEELVAFVNHATWSALMTSTELSRQLVPQDFTQGGLNFKVKTLNGVAIIPVSSDRMKTDYEYYTGRDGNADIAKGGFAAAEGAKDIYSIVMPKRAASLIKKSEKMRVFTPEQNIDADAYKFDYRIYYDCLVKKSNADKIFAIVGA